MTHLRHGRLLLSALLVCTALAHPLSAQTQDADAASLSLTESMVDMLVGAMALSAPGGVPVVETDQLLAALVADPLVSSVLSEAGAVDLQGPAGSSPWNASGSRLQEFLASGSPEWLTRSMQVSVEMSLPVVMPLNVLLVLTREPDAAVETFLSRYGLAAPAVSALSEAVLVELSKTFDSA
jgi:hypothetical protein